MYDSLKILNDYEQLKCNMHLYLLDKGLIEDQDPIHKIIWKHIDCYVVKAGVFYEDEIAVDILEFNGYVERGFKFE